MGRRARSPAAKDARRQALVQAAAEVFGERRYAAVSMAEIARRAGVAKGTTYLYFPTKETLFLDLFLRRLSTWIEEIMPVLQVAKSANDVADAFADTLANHEQLVRLIGLLHGTLEQNVEAEDALAFKRQLIVHLAPVAMGIEVAAKLPAGDGVRAIVQIQAMAVGIAQMAFPTPAVTSALENEDVAVMRVEFCATMRHTVGALLRGWV
jgi:AcrR family transcriptional regulator